MQHGLTHGDLNSLVNFYTYWKRFKNEGIKKLGVTGVSFEPCVPLSAWKQDRKFTIPEKLAFLYNAEFISSLITDSRRVKL